MTKPRGILLCLLLVAMAIGLRAPFLGRTIWNPDEGVTVTAAEMILDGAVLYRDIAEQRSPLVPYLKAGVLAVCGHWNLVAIHVLVALLAGVAAIGLWRVAALLGNGRAGLVAAAVFGALCFVYPDSYDALAAHTEWFLLFFSVMAFWAFAASVDSPGPARGLGVGALFGLSCLSKQPGVFDWGTAMVLVALLIWSAPERRKALLGFGSGLVGGFAVVVGGTAVCFALAGAWPELLYFSWSYNNEVYLPAIPVWRRLATMEVPFTLAATNIPAVFAAGVLGAFGLIRAVFRPPLRGALRPRLLWWLALGWTAGGIWATGLSGRGYSHYSIQVIPGLALVCGLSTTWCWDFARNQGRLWRYAAVAGLAWAAGDSVWRVVLRFRSIEATEPEWTRSLQLVSRATAPEDRVFFWGFSTDCYVFARRLPATRHIYSSFLTGLTPWANVDPSIDTRDLVTPGSWDGLREDFARHPPKMIIGLGSLRFATKYPLHEQPWLWSYLTANYARVAFHRGTKRDFEFYQRLERGDPDRVLPACNPPGAGVDLAVLYTDHAQPTPQAVVHAPAGGKRCELFADGVLFRTLSMRSGESDVAFFIPPGEITAPEVTLRAVVTYDSGCVASTPVVLARAAVERRLSQAPGPAIKIGSSEIRPVGSETIDGLPLLRSAAPEGWEVPAPATVLYLRPAGLRSFTAAFGLDPDVYYDRPDRRASDGADLVIEYTPEGGKPVRIHQRRLSPKTNPADRGLQRWEHVFPQSERGLLSFRVLSGPEADEAHDRMYLQEMTGSGYGPPAAFGPEEILAERVSAHRDPLMICDAGGRWIAHSPSSVSYCPPDTAGGFEIGFGMEPGCYDGTQPGKTDGVVLEVAGVTAGGETRTLLRRRIDPAAVAADRGPQGATVEFAPGSLRLLTVTIEAGPDGNDAFDWSYLAAPRFTKAEDPAGR